MSGLCGMRSPNSLASSSQAQPSKQRCRLARPFVGRVPVPCWAGLRTSSPAGTETVTNKDAATPLVVSRRVAGSLLLATGAALTGASASCSPALARPPLPLPLPACNGPLDGQLAAALTRAVYATVVEQQVMDEAEFQRENFKLREREYRYYANANPQMPRIPQLADNTGGLSNPDYFNFVNYVLWKVVYRHISSGQEREAFARAAAADFLGRVWPAASSTQATAASVAAAAATPSDAVLRTLLPFLDMLRSSGYVCSYQLVLNDHPGTWPQDWMLSQPVLMDGYGSALDDRSYAGTIPSGGVEAAALPSTPTPSGRGADAAADYGSVGFDAGSESGSGSGSGDLIFQIKLHRPADIAGSVAIRSEESGAWPRTVSNCLTMLLQPLGYRAADSAAAAAVSSSSAEGAGVVEVDEFFYQDEWQGPKKLTDQLLLFFGDPLEQVGVDFTPSTLVQNWRLRRGPA